MKEKAVVGVSVGIGVGNPPVGMCVGLEVGCRVGFAVGKPPVGFFVDVGGQVAGVGSNVVGAVVGWPSVADVGLLVGEGGAISGVASRDRPNRR